jgi:anti-sigma factor RsiW
MAHLDREIEEIAAGERHATREERAHLDACEACARALTLATEIDRVLASQPPPVAPEHFIAATLTRVRRERWRSEQRLDLAFNVIVGLAGLIGLAGLWIVLTAAGVLSMSAGVATVFVDVVNQAFRAFLPVLPMYVLAAAVLFSGLGVWWWAEHGLEQKGSGGPFSVQSSRASAPQMGRR